MPRLSRAFALFASAATALALSACAYGGGGYYMGHPSEGVEYNGYYDDAYGPIADGYWGPDNVFMYSTGPGGPYQRDDAHHIQREAAPGRHQIHGHHAGQPANAEHHDH